MKINFILIFLLSCGLIVANQSPKIDYTRGIYLRTDIVTGAQFDTLMTLSKAAAINTVVFDIKDMKGRVYIDIKGCPTLISYPGDLKINLERVVDKIHQADMKAVARIVAFHNKRAAVADSTLCPSDSLGNRWIESYKKGPQWLDPSNSVVQNDLFALIDSVIAGGVDEIQFDYIRFPTQGNINKAVFDFNYADRINARRDSSFIPRTKIDIIEDFLKRTHQRYQMEKVSFTADIFAIVSWQNIRDIEATGQDIARISPLLDALHPMIYSSHFADNFNYRQNVHNEPFDITFKGTKRTIHYINGKCQVIPYIQANNWQVNYKKEYMAAQIAACRLAGAKGFILWNATVNYKTTLGWLAELKESQ